MHLQIAIDIFRDLPYLAVNGIIVFWYLYQVMIGTRKFIRNQNDISGPPVTTRVIIKIIKSKFQWFPVQSNISFHLAISIEGSGILLHASHIWVQRNCSTDTLQS